MMDPYQFCLVIICIFGPSMVHGGTKGDEADVIIRNIMSGRVIKLVEFQDLIIMRYHVKLEIRLFVMNFNIGEVFNKGKVLCSGNWLWAWQISG